MKTAKFWLAVIPLCLSLSAVAGGLSGVNSEIRPLDIDRGEAIGGYLEFNSCVTRFEAAMNCRDACERAQGERRPWVLDEDAKECELQYHTPIGCYCVK